MIHSSLLEEFRRYNYEEYHIFTHTLINLLPMDQSLPAHQGVRTGSMVTEAEVASPAEPHRPAESITPAEQSSNPAEPMHSTTPAEPRPQQCPLQEKVGGALESMDVGSALFFRMKIPRMLWSSAQTALLPGMLRPVSGTSCYLVVHTSKENCCGPRT